MFTGKQQNVRIGRRKPRHLGRLAGILGLGLLCLASAVPALAQGTGGYIFGSGPAGETVTIHSSTGMSRHTVINDEGRYKLRPLPLGTYTVTLENDGKVVDTRHNIPLTVSRGVEVDFLCPNDQCAASAQQGKANP